MYFSLILTFCLLGFARGQSSITASPSTSITVGETINITCDSGNSALNPALRINGALVPNDHPRVMVVSISSGVRVFEFSSVMKSDDGSVFSCVNVDGFFTLEVLFGPELQANIGDITVDNGGSATVSFTVDANPAITADNITVTIGGESVGFTASIDGNMVNLTLSNLQTTGQYTVNVTNSIGMDSFNFLVNVMSATSTSSTMLTTMMTSSTETTSMSTSSSSSSSTSTSISSSSSVTDFASTMTRPSSTATATPGATNQPTNSAVGVQANVFLLALLIIFIVFVMH